MAFALLTANAGTAVAKASSTSLSGAPTTQCNVGDIVIVTCVTDNVATTSTDNSTLHSISDAAGNTWTKIKEYTRATAAAADGVTVSSWISKITTAITTSTNIILTTSSAVTSKAMGFSRFSIGAGMTYQVASQTGGAGGSSTAPSVTIASLTSAAYLLVGVVGLEGEVSTITKDADYTALNTVISSTAGAADTNVVMWSYYRLATLTSDSMAESGMTSGDWATILGAVREVAEAQTATVPLVQTSALSITGSKTISPAVALAQTSTLDVAGSKTITPAITMSSSSTLDVVPPSNWTINARHSGNNGQTSSQTQATNSTTPTANSLLLIGFGAGNDNHSTTQVHQAPSGGGLSYSQVGSTPSHVVWGGSGSMYGGTGSLWRAAVGASPSAFAITVDAYSGTNAGFYSAVAIDVTGHDTSNPIIQTAQASSTEGSGGSGSNGPHDASVTLGAEPSSGSLLIVFAFSAADGSGGFLNIEAGSGKTLTQAHSVNTGGSGYTQAAIFARECDGTESDTITISDVGQIVGFWALVAVELRPAGSAGQQATVALASTSSLSITPSIDHPFAVAMASSSTLGVAPLVTHPYAIELAQTSALAVTPALTRVASVALASTSALSITPLVTKIAAVALASVSSMSVAGLQTIPPAVGLVATSALSISGFKSITSAVTLASTSSLGVVANVGTVITLASVSGLSVTGLQAISVALALAQTSSLSITPLVTHPYAVALASTSALAITPLVSVVAAVALTQTSALSVIGQKTITAVVGMSQASTLVITAALTRVAAVSLVQASTLGVAGRQTILPLVPLVSASTIGVVVQGSQQASVLLAQASVLSITGFVSKQATVTLAQTSSLLIVPQLGRVGVVTLTQASELMIGTSFVRFAALPMVSAMELLINAQVSLKTVLDLAGRVAGGRWTATVQDGYRVRGTDRWRVR